MLQPMENPDGQDVLMPVVQPFGSRDGTLAKDAMMLNCIPERTSSGMVAVKRPGLKFYCLLGLSAPAGSVGQGMFTVGNTGYGVVDDYVFRLSDQNAYPLDDPGPAGQPYQFLPDSEAGGTILKNQSNLWRVFDTVSSAVSDSNYPALTVPGIVELDGTYYVMAADDGTIRGSELEDVTAWDPLSFIGPNTSMGAAVALHRHLNYLVGFYSKGIQFFYNAGNPTGSSLARVDNASWLTGCASAQSIARLEDSTFFMSQSDQLGRSVYMFQGLQMVKISDPAVERVLNKDSLAGLTAVCVKMAGHELYILSLPSSNVSLVYDVGYQLWMPWTSYIGAIGTTASDVQRCFRGGAYIAANGLNLLQDPDNGIVYSIDTDYYNDQTACLVTTPPFAGFGDKRIRVEVVTSKRSWGSHRRKFLPVTSIHGDTADTTVQVSYTDNDYRDWSANRPVNMGTERKMLQRCGSSRERAWRIIHEEATPLRLLGVEVEVEAGVG